MRGEQEEQRLPRWLRVTLGTVGDILLFAALSLVIWTVLPAVALGATPVIISGGSMAPLIRTGDVILLDDTAPPDGEFFAPGTVVTYDATDSAGNRTGELVTHRVASLSDGEYVTRGDANASDDPRTVHPENLVGVGRWLVPFVGLPAHWARTGAWHLVLATVLVGAAAAAASVAGRRRIVIEELEELEEERIDELPLEPILPEPVLAFQLQLEPDAVDPAGDDLEPAAHEPAALEPAAMDPAAAERAATIAAQAARRAGAGLDRLREQEREEETQARPTRHDGGTGGAAGSAPVASVIALAIALLSSTIAPTFAAAAFVATTSSTGNSFAAAPAEPTGDLTVDVVVTDDWGTGYCADVLVSTTSTVPIVWEVEVDLSTHPLSGTPYTVWNSIHTFDAPIITASGAGNGWNDTVAAGSPAPWGFCANRPAASSYPLVHPAGEFHTSAGPNNLVVYPTISLTTSAAHTAAAPLSVTLNVVQVRGSNNSTQVTVTAPGHPGSLTASAVIGTTGQHTLVLSGDLAADLPAGSTVDVVIATAGVSVDVSSGSSIALPN